jgi:hypothetical protein
MVQAAYIKEKLAEVELPLTPREYVMVLRDAQKRDYMKMNLSKSDELILRFFKRHKKAVSRLVSEIREANN